MKFMMFIKHAENFRVEDVPPGLMAAMGEFVEGAMQRGTIIDTAGLRPTSEGQRLSLHGGKIKVVDGPFTEAKEVVGGYAIVNAASKPEALEFARKFMELHREHWPQFEGACEVRAIDGG